MSGTVGQVDATTSSPNEPVTAAYESGSADMAAEALRAVQSVQEGQYTLAELATRLQKLTDQASQGSPAPTRPLEDEQRLTRLILAAVEDSRKVVADTAKALAGGIVGGETDATVRAFYDSTLRNQCHDPMIHASITVAAILIIAEQLVEEPNGAGGG